MLWEFTYEWTDGPDAAADDPIMQECADLFSAHYGVWGQAGPQPGKPVKRSAKHVAALLDHPAAHLATARHKGQLIGYAAAMRLQLDDGRLVAWVNQLVVHGAFRQSRAATHLLYSIWHFSDIYACGLVTANPLAVRALETATRRTCKASLVSSRAPELLPALSEASGYIPPALATNQDGRPVPRVNTQFYVSRDDMPALRKRAARSDRPWALEEIGPGQEWVAVTFGDQEPTPMQQSKIRELLRGADGIWIQAYELMSLDEKHAWRRNTDAEIDHILRVAGLTGGRVLDVGCGDGRHSARLAALGFDTVGQEIAPALAGRAQEAAPTARIVQGDARRSLPPGPFDVVLCLYDVLGSSGEAADDQALLANIFESLRPGGWLALSVMNEAVVSERLPPENRPIDHAEFIRALERLTPSRAMETTGTVFNPEHIVFYDGVYYRKEQFLRPETRLPAELVIRDRRYGAEQLGLLLDEAGFRVVDIKPVQAGQWHRDPPLDPNDERAKEWLVMAVKPVE